MLSAVGLDGHNDVGRSTHDDGVGCGRMFVWNALGESRFFRLMGGVAAIAFY